MIRRFPNEDKARLHIEKMRWNGHPVCPKCQAAEKQYSQNRKNEPGYYECGFCGKVYTVRVGTIFERSHVPLHKWLFSIYLVCTARKGVSSLQLSKEIGVSQKAAWFMLQRIRKACQDDNQNDGNSFLRGVVEADETYIGGLETNKHESKKLKAGRGTVGKTAVLGIRERGGRVKAQLLSSTGQTEIQAAVRSAVAPGAVLCTDEHAAYDKMPEFGHRTVAHSAKQFVDGMAHTNGIESVWAVLKRAFYGIYHSFSAKHMQLYLNEVCFRLKSGNVLVHTLDRINSVLGMSVGKRLTYASLVGASTGGSSL